MRHLLIIGITLLYLTSCKKEEFGNEDIIYTISFVGNWNNINHPLNYPSDDHFSPITGMIHNDKVSLFKKGSIASSGIEIMSESGNTTILISEIAQNGNNVFKTIKMSGANTGIDTVKYQFDVNDSHTYISLVSMIAPSPDWFVALNNYNLKPNGEWIQKVTIPMLAYDAGTEEGIEYSYSNDDEIPKLPITLLDVPTIKNENSIKPLAYIILEKYIVYNN